MLGADPQTVWQRVADTMTFDLQTFRDRILDRLPLTLKAVSHHDARSQREALLACGAEAVELANPEGKHLWLKCDGETRGPVSEGYVRHAIEMGLLDRTASGCVKGEQIWLPLEHLLRLPSSNVKGGNMATTMKAYASDAAPSVTSGSEFSSGANAHLPTKRMPTWVKVAGALVVVLLIAIPIAAAIALPQYQTYTIRAEAEEAMTLTQDPRSSVEDYVSSTGMLPANNADAGLDKLAQLHGHYVSAVSAANGTLVVDFNTQAVAQLRGKRMMIIPTRHDRVVSWNCVSYTIDPKFLPTECHA